MDKRTILGGVLFVIGCVIVYYIVTLFHYSYIEQKIKKYSRCNNATSDTSKIVYKVRGVALIHNATKGKKEKRDIYEITYNFNDKKYVIEQLSPFGSKMNTIQIPVYNLQTYIPEHIEKIFESEDTFSTDNITFEGDPELVRFMHFGNTDFFEKKLF